MYNWTRADGTPLSKEEFFKKLETDDDFYQEFGNKGIDQISELITQLKENPDSRRLIVNAWAVDDLPNMALPPCHYGFQVYTRELSSQERKDLYDKTDYTKDIFPTDDTGWNNLFDECNIPKRAISLIWNQRSCDTFLGIPFNIASYGLLLSIIAEIVNMVPDELIGNLGDTHLYVDHLDAVKEQIGRELTKEERQDMFQTTGMDAMEECERKTELYNMLPTNTREPFPLPTLEMNTEFWAPGTEAGCLGEPGTYEPNIDGLIKSFEIDDFQLIGYKSHPPIKAKLLT